MAEARIVVLGAEGQQLVVAVQGTLADVEGVPLKSVFEGSRFRLRREEALENDIAGDVVHPQLHQVLDVGGDVAHPAQPLDAFWRQLGRWIGGCHAGGVGGVTGMAE